MTTTCDEPMTAILPAGDDLRTRLSRAINNVLTEEALYPLIVSHHKHLRPMSGHDIAMFLERRLYEYTMATHATRNTQADAWPIIRQQHLEPLIRALIDDADIVNAALF